MATPSIACRFLQGWDYRYTRCNLPSILWGVVEDNGSLTAAVESPPATESCCFDGVCCSCFPGRMPASAHPAPRTGCFGKARCPRLLGCKQESTAESSSPQASQSPSSTGKPGCLASCKYLPWHQSEDTPTKPVDGEQGEQPKRKQRRLPHSTILPGLQFSLAGILGKPETFYDVPVIRFVFEIFSCM